MSSAKIRIAFRNTQNKGLHKWLPGQQITQDVFHKVLIRLCLCQVFDFIKVSWIYIILGPSFSSKNDEALIPAPPTYLTADYNIYFNLNSQSVHYRKSSFTDLLIILEIWWETAAITFHWRQISLLCSSFVSDNKAPLQEQEAAADKLRLI